MTVLDTSGQSVSVERNVMVVNGVSPWEAWRLAKFIAADRQDTAADTKNVVFIESRQ